MHFQQSIAEGFEVLQQSGYDFSYEAVAKLWNNGSVIRGWLMELVQQVFAKDPDLESIKGIMRSSGEGKWLVETALEKNISTPVIALSLLMRYRSLQDDTFSALTSNVEPQTSNLKIAAWAVLVFC